MERLGEAIIPYPYLTKRAHHTYSGHPVIDFSIDMDDVCIQLL